MPISDFINKLKIVSSFGYKRSGNAINGPRMNFIETTQNLWEPEERPLSFTEPPVKIIRVNPNPMPPFVFPPGNTATQNYTILDYNTPELQEQLRWWTTATTQTLYISNVGTTDVNITGVLQNFPQPDATVAVFHSTTTMTISPGNTGTVILGYYGSTPGEFSSFLVVQSDWGAGNYRVRTSSQVQETYDIDINRINPTGDITTASAFGQQLFLDYSVTPIINLIPRDDVTVPLSIVVESEGSAFSAGPIDGNNFKVKFRAQNVNNVNGLYTATVTVYSQSAVNTVTSYVNLDIDYARFANLGTWISAAAPDNSVVGMSYDIIDNQRTLTIGVGVGGDSTPELSEGGLPFVTTGTLSFIGTYTDYPYAGWATVYRIPLTGEPRRYLSGVKDSNGVYQYRVKPERLEQGQGLYPETDTEYDRYFGVETSPGSMFIVDDDGAGNLTIALNQLQTELTEIAGFNRTLKNLTRSFHYYSSVDDPARYTQLNPGPILDGTVTRLFYGFDNSGTVLTSIVSLPAAN
jgi:hypothetical protein